MRQFNIRRNEAISTFVTVRGGAGLAGRARLPRALARSLRTRDVSVGVQLDRYAQPTGTGNSFSLSKVNFVI